MSIRFRRRAALAVLLVLPMFVAFAGRSYLSPTSVPPLPSTDQQEGLLAFARAHLTGDPSIPETPAIRSAGIQAVIVTTYAPGRKVSAWADLDERGVGEAVEEAAAEVRRKGGARGTFRVRLDLTGGEKRVRFFGERALEATLDPGVDGLVVRGERFAFVGPSERVESGGTAADLADRLARIAGRKARKEIDGILRYRAASFIEAPADPEWAGAGALPIARGNVLPPWPPSPEDLRLASARGGAYLAGKVDPQGRFLYQFDAAEGHREPGYNLLRHCGTTMSMFQVYSLTRDPVLAEAGERALQYVIDRHVFEDPAVPGAVFLRERNWTKQAEFKLGALGLGVLAFLAADEAGVELTEERRELVRKMGRGILHLQRPSGELASYHATAEDPGSARRSIYYPGEANLALIRLYRWDGDPSWLEAAIASADFQVDDRWTWGGLEVQVPPDAWGAQALEELFAETKDPGHARYAFRIGDEILLTTFPRDAGVPPDLLGAAFTYERLPRVTPTSSRNEAIVALARLAREVGDEERARRYREAAVDAAWFGITHQFRPENVYFTRDPAGALGGIRESIVDNSVRIDGVQHAVTGFLGLADLLDKGPEIEVAR